MEAAGWLAAASVSPANSYLRRPIATTVTKPHFELFFSLDLLHQSISKKLPKKCISKFLIELNHIYKIYIVVFKILYIYIYIQMYIYI